MLFPSWRIEMIHSFKLKLSLCTIRTGKTLNCFHPTQTIYWVQTGRHIASNFFENR